MNPRLRSVLCLCAIAAVVVTSSCSAVVGTLDGIVDGTAALEPIVAASSAAGQIPPATATVVMNYLEAVSTAASNSVTEWESKDSETVKIATIGADFASVPAPALGPGVSVVIVTSISSIDLLVSQLMEQIGASNSGAASASAKTLVLHGLDKQNLNRLKTKAGKNVASVEAWKAQQRVKTAMVK